MDLFTSYGDTKKPKLKYWFFDDFSLNIIVLTIFSPTWSCVSTLIDLNVN